MLTKLLRATVQKITLPIGRGIAAAGVTANHMTLLGAAIVFVSAGLIAGGRPFVGGFVMLGGAAFDMLDGAVARARSDPGKFGAFLDSTLDRLSDGVVLGSIAMYLLSEPPSSLLVTAGLEVGTSSLVYFGVGITLICMVLGFLTSYIRARAEGLGYSCAVGIAERTERTLLLAVGLIVPRMLLVSLSALAVVSAITVVQRFVHVWSQARTSRG